MTQGVGLVDVARIVLADPATVEIPLLLQHLGVASVVVWVDVEDSRGAIFRLAEADAAALTSFRCCDLFS